MFTPSVALYFIILIISVILSVSSPTWLGAWIGLELNLMSFVPLMLLSTRLNTSESVIKYFLVQALSSMLFLLSLLSSFLFSDEGFINLFLNLPMYVALFIKLGASPFHMWFPIVSSGLSWGLNYLLMTWQKLAPLVLIFYFIEFNLLVLGVVLMSAYVGAVGGLNQMSLRKLMAYSSINHLSWMLISMLFKINYFLLYYGVYMLTSGILVYIFMSCNIFYLSQIYYYSSLNLGWFILFLSLFSFGGLPPFLGFLPKGVVLDLMIDYNLFFVSLFMVLMSLISLYYYMRLSYISLLQSRSELVGGYPLCLHNYTIMIIMCCTLMGLLSVPLLVNLL